MAKQKRHGVASQWRVPLCIHTEMVKRLNEMSHHVERERVLDLGPASGLVMRWWFLQPWDRQLEILRQGREHERKFPARMEVDRGESEPSMEPASEQEAGETEPQASIKPAEYGGVRNRSGSVRFPKRESKRISGRRVGVELNLSGKHKS